MGPYKPLRTWVDEFIPYYREIMGVYVDQCIPYYREIMGVARPNRTHGFVNPRNVTHGRTQ